MTRRVSVFSVLCLVLAATAVRGADEPRNLILISLDTLRADRLGCYGNQRPTSPAIDGLAREGVLFEDASATAPWTKPSHASLLTGLYPARAGATSWTGLLSERAVTLASWLARHGFRTAAIVNSRMLASHGLERGFTHLDASELPQGQRQGSSISDAAIRWLGQRDRQQRFFLFLHYMDMHSDYESLARYEEQFVTPYEGPLTGSTQQLYRIAEGRMRASSADARHLIDLYDASLRQLDDQLGRLIEHLRATELLDSTLVVLTADHGEEFLEHGGVIHGQTQYQEVIRVPLIFRGPGVARGARFRDPVSLVDVVPTCLGLLGTPPLEDLDGVALQELWRRTGYRLAPRFLFFDADVTFPPPAPGVVPPGTSRAVRWGRFKLHYDLATRQVRLFDLDADPGEKTDVQAKHAEVAAVLTERLRQYLEHGSEPQLTRELTPQQLEALRSLGYVGGD